MRESLASATVPHLTSCDQEPIHVPGSIQPHGVLIILDNRLRVVQCSANSGPLLGISVENALGQTLSHVVGTPLADAVQESHEREALDDNPVFIDNFVIREGRFDVTVHKRFGNCILELEKTEGGESALASKAYVLLRKTVATLRKERSLQELLNVAAREFQRLTHFDRVLIYKFGPDWSGTVVAEAKTDRLPSYMDLRFPESDIPRQARDLYRLNRVRLIANANYTPVPLVPPLHPETGLSPDLTFSALRSVSPLHIEYMKNMGTLASMSVSIMREDRLWGLVACHDHAPSRVPVPIRFACELIGQVLSSQISAALEHEANVRQAQLQTSQQRLLTSMGEAESFVDAITANSVDLLNCVGADGAAVLFEDQCELMGRTPSEAQVRELCAWLAQTSRHELFVTDELSTVYPESKAYQEDVSGVLALCISEYRVGYLLWFRPEKATELKWAGNPSKIEVAVDGRIHPRKSFQSWTEREQGRSHPWNPAEVNSASNLKNAVITLVLRKAQMLASLSSDLQRSNSELEAFSYSVSHDLRAPFRHIVGYAELLKEQDSITGENRRYVETIIESANFAGLLVDHLLSFAQIGRSKLNLSSVPLKLLANELVTSIESEIPERTVSWQIGELPEVTADLFLIRLALDNLIRNAVKYSRPRKIAKIEIGCSAENSEHVIFVRDNGVGFDMQFSSKLFGVFQRLHRMEEFEGTGIGLATVRRIVERHGGKTWAEGQIDKGATFFFSIPSSRSAE